MTNIAKTYLWPSSDKFLYINYIAVDWMPPRVIGAPNIVFSDQQGVTI